MNARPVFVIEDSSEEDEGDDRKLVALSPQTVDSDPEDHLWCCWLFRKKK